MNLTSTPPRASYAEKVKGIFASHRRSESEEAAQARMTTDSREPSVIRANGSRAPVIEGGKRLFLHFADEEGSCGSNGQGGVGREEVSPPAVRKSEDESALRSEFGLERRADSFVFESPKETATHEDAVGDLKEESTNPITEITPAFSPHPEDLKARSGKQVSLVESTLTDPALASIPQRRDEGDPCHKIQNSSPLVEHNIPQIDLTLPAAPPPTACTSENESINADIAITSPSRRVPASLAPKSSERHPLRRNALIATPKQQSPIKLFVAQTNLAPPTTPSPTRRQPQEEEEESSDAWTDDSQYLPAYAMRRRKREARRQRLERERERGRIHCDKLLSRAELSRCRVPASSTVQAATKLGLMEKGKQPGVAAPTQPAMWMRSSPKPSRFTAAAAVPNPYENMRKRIFIPHRVLTREDSVGGMGRSTRAPQEQKVASRLPPNFRACDADDEDSDTGW